MIRNIHFSILLLPLLIALTLLLGSCRSVEKLTVSRLSHMLSSDSGAGAFTRDDDPQLIADALPFALKMYELLMDMNPEDSALRLAAGKSFIMYANGFIQTPSTMLGDEEYEKQQKMLERAQKMYIRGKGYILDSLALEVKGSRELIEFDLDGFLEKCNKKQVPQLYWAAAGWLGAISCDSFNIEMTQEVYKPINFLYRALELDEEYGKGSIHDLLLNLWASMPGSLIEGALMEAPEMSASFVPGYYSEHKVLRDEESKARFHFSRAVDLSEGKNPASYISLALSFPVKKQDYKEFESLLLKALELNPYDDPETELLVVIYQERAAWLLEHREDYFLSDF